MMNISMVLLQTMNDSDDDLLSSAVDGLVEDEDWTDTTWAQPVLPAAASSLIKVGISGEQKRCLFGYIWASF